MVFLSGDHTLDMHITVATVSWLIICRVSSSDSIATVIHNYGIDLKIYSISCSMSWKDGSHPVLLCSALHLIHNMLTVLSIIITYSV